MISYNKHIRAIVKLGAPLIVAQIGMIVMGLADTFMVGNHNAKELAAAGFVNPLFALIIVFALGFSYGLTPVVGTRYGQKDVCGIARALRGALMANGLMASLLTFVVFLLYANLHHAGLSDELLPLVRPYLLTQIASIPFILAFNLLKQFSDGVGDTRTSMWVMLLGNVLNIVGNWLLIFGHFGLPEMGLTGAGLATLFSRMATFVVFAYLFLRTRRYAVYREAFLKNVSWPHADFVLLNRMGWPIALQMGMETASFSLCAFFLARIGEAALSANQIMSSVSSLCFMMYYGIGAAVAVRSSHFYGRGEVAEVRHVATTGMMLVLVAGIIMSGLVFLLRFQFGRLVDDPDVERTLLTLMLPFLLYQLGDSMQTNYANALRGIGDVKPLMFYAFIAYVVISLPASYIFGIVLEGGARGVWLGFPLGLTVAGVLFMRRFYHTCR